MKRSIATLMATAILAMGSARADEVADVAAFAKIHNAKFRDWTEGMSALEFTEAATDDDLAALAKLAPKQLRNLELTKCAKITDAGFLKLVASPGTQILYLPPQLSDKAYVDMAKRFPAVWTIGVFGTEAKPGSITSDGVKAISAMPALRDVNVQWTHADDGCWESLGKIAGLNTLTLYGSKITDDGLLIFASKAESKHLQSVHVKGAKITDIGIAEMKRLMPKVMIGN